MASLWCLRMLSVYFRCLENWLQQQVEMVSSNTGYLKKNVFLLESVLSSGAYIDVQIFKAFLAFLWLNH